MGDDRKDNAYDTGGPKISGTFVDELFDSDTFSAIHDLVVNVGRHIHQDYDPEFVRYSIHNFSPLAEVHEQIVPFASELFGEPLKRSYCFLSMYLTGGRVPIHVDRPQCYRTIDLMVNQDDDIPWPLWVAKPWTDEQWAEYDGPRMGNHLIPDQLSDNWDEVVLQPNQAYCYSGTHSWHLRPTTATSRTDLIFFHFVQEDYDGGLD